MKIRPKFSLRALFVFVTLCAIAVATFLTWRKSTLDWIEARHDFLQSDSFGEYGVFRMGRVNGQTMLPWYLRLFGETECNCLIHIISDKATVPDAGAKVQKLFPEAWVVAKTSDEWEADRPINRPPPSKTEKFYAPEVHKYFLSLR